VDLRITANDPKRGTRIVGGKLVDVSNSGLGVDTLMSLPPGSWVLVVAVGTNGAPTLEARVRVVYCRDLDNGGYRLGLCFDEGVENPFSQTCRASSDDFVDFYELMQLSPNADLDTIHRVYRMLAQRYHPDNADTGEEERFKVLLQAYQVLTDPEQRAAYDIRYRSRLRRQWKIFDQASATQGVEAERHKRRGILSLLYNKRINEPQQPALNILELEELLGCPREHLECSLWYLREMGWIIRADNGRYCITAKGFDQAEATGGAWPRTDRLLTTSAMDLPQAAAD
jgi:hypothetical protein